MGSLRALVTDIVEGKTCCSCREFKKWDEFNNDCRIVDGYSRACKPCQRAYSRKSYSKHKDTRRSAHKAYKHTDRGREVNNASVRRTGHGRHMNVKRRIRMRTCVLSQMHDEHIKIVYAFCPEGYHVDHIVPLFGENVSGLHAPWNLQYLPALDNFRKGNRIGV